MKIKQLIKKYKYLTKTALKRKSRFFIKRLVYFFNDVDPYSLSPLEVEKLSYPVKWPKYYGLENINVELGTGHGELLKLLATKNRKDLNIGFEITKTYALKTKKKIKDLDNALVFKGDGYQFTLDLFSDDSINKIYILFPDPWHKKKHHKRRPISSKWLSDIHKKLIPEGQIFFATDWDDYYDHVLEQLYEVEDDFLFEEGSYHPKEFGLIETHYYKKWNEMGRTFKYIQIFKK